MQFRLSFIKARNLILTIALIGIAFFIGYYFGVEGYKAEITKSLQVNLSRQVPAGKNMDFSIFWQVWDSLASKYYDKSKLNLNQMVYGATSGMVGALGDPFTMFLPPSQNKNVNEDLSGSIEGIGTQLGFDKNARLIVYSPLSGSPAEKAGVKAGDFIVRIKDVKKNIDIDTAGINLNDAVFAIRGKAGTNVILTLGRVGSDKPIVMEITRAKIDVPSVELTYVGANKNIAHIKVNSFNAETTSEWNKVVDKIVLDKNINGVILDLRNNPGGYLQDSVDLAGDFLKTGSVVLVEEDGNGKKIDFKTSKPGRLLSMPVVVIINGGSASASEILSGALRDQINAKLIGEKSFGKGTVQEPMDFSDGSGLHVTIAKWLTPNGTWVHGKGLTPDIEVENKVASDDAQLQKAIELFK